MNLIKDKWLIQDKGDYYSYLNSLSKKDKIEWTRNIVNTNMEVLAIPVPVLKSIGKEIMKGDYVSFLDLKLLDNYESTMVYGSIINNIKDIELVKYYLDIYVNYVDNWSSCDILSINVKDKDKLFNIGMDYTYSNKPFIRRIGFRILFKYVDNIEYLDKIFKRCDEFYNEEHYYVNMMIAWLLCEAFIKNRDYTLNYLDNNKLNEFVINKTISKCRDSFRVSKNDKELLLKYKRKICQK